MNVTKVGCLAVGVQGRFMSVNGMVRPCSGPASKGSWQGATKHEEHAMSHKLNSAIAVIGIDIGKNPFHVVGHDTRGTSTLRRLGRARRWKHDWPTCHPV
jgi:hypothetical protein